MTSELLIRLVTSLCSRQDEQVDAEDHLVHGEEELRQTMTNECPILAQLAHGKQAEDCHGRHSYPTG